MKVKKALTGNGTVSEVMRQINPDVVAIYPITPSTQIMEDFSQFLADGLVDTELMRVESEHSAMSACIGASAAGARVMTATSSQGLALMWEMLYIASGLRLPIVMNVVNRALSAPINIHCDHSDSIGARDSGWIQIYSENAQEVYENNLLALKLAEKIKLPVMVMQDGFITSHCVEGVNILKDSEVKKFIGEYNPKYSLLKNNFTFGPLALPDYYFEIKLQQILSIGGAKKEYLKVGKELSKLTGNKYGYFEEYNIGGAKSVIVVMNSTAGIVKGVVDELRKKGKMVGLLKIKLFRPFPYDEIKKSLNKVKNIIVMDRSVSYGANAPLFSEIKNSLSDKNKIYSCIFGLGGRNIYEEDIKNIFIRSLNGKLGKFEYIGVRK